MSFTIRDILAMSMGTQVARMNSLFTRKLGDAPCGSKNAGNQHAYSKSEWDETVEAMEHGYVSDEFRDGIADLFTTVIGSLWRAGDEDSTIFHLYSIPSHGGEQHFNSEAFNNYKTEIDRLVDDLSCFVSLQGILKVSNKSFVEKLRELLNVLLQFASLVGIDPHADLSQVTLANLSKLCQGQDALERTYEKYKEIGVELYHEEVEPNIFAVFSKGDQVGTDGKTYDADKFLKSSDWHEPYFPSMTKDSAAAAASMAVAQVQTTPKAQLVDEKGQPLI